MTKHESVAVFTFCHPCENQGLSSLKQPPFLISQSEATSPTQLTLLCLTDGGRAVSLAGASGDGSASKLTRAVGRIQCHGVVGLRSLRLQGTLTFLGWGPPFSSFQPPALAEPAPHTGSLLLPLPLQSSEQLFYL